MVGTGPVAVSGTFCRIFVAVAPRYGLLGTAPDYSNEVARTTPIPIREFPPVLAAKRQESGLGNPFRRVKHRNSLNPRPDEDAVTMNPCDLLCLHPWF